MKIIVKEEKKGELKEKKLDLIKALFPSINNVEENINIPERKFREPAVQDMMDKMDERYQKMVSQMIDAIEEVLTRNRGE